MVKVLDDSSNVIETYTYGASRERLINTTATQRTYYAWGGNPLVEYSEPIASSTLTWAKSYVYAGSRLVSTTTNVSGTEVLQFHHPDRTGTGLISTPSVDTYEQHSTLPFGTALNWETTTSTNQTFTSYDRSAGTGLDYAVNRTYSSGQGRFTQVDPIGMESASVGNPQSSNLFAYTQNSPTDFIDPSGLLIAIPQYSCEGVVIWDRWVTVCTIDGWWIIDDNPGSGSHNPVDDPGAGGGGGTPHLDPEPNNLFADPCEGKKGQLDYSRVNKQGENAAQHILNRHIRPNSDPTASRYVFPPDMRDGDLEKELLSMGSAVAGLNIITFDNAVGVPSGNNVVYSLAFPSQTIKTPFGNIRIDVPVGIDNSSGINVGQTTNVNTVIVANDCKHVITSHPGPSRDGVVTGIPQWFQNRAPFIYGR